MVLRPGRGTRSGDGPAPPAVARRLRDEGRGRASAGADRSAAQAGRDSVEDSALRVDAYLDQWFEGVRPALRPSTAKSYGEIVRWYLRPRLGAVRLCDLNAIQVRALYADLSRAGSVRSGGPLAPATIAAVHRVLRKACNDAVDAGLLTRSPLVGVRPHDIDLDPTACSRFDVAVWSVGHEVARGRAEDAVRSPHGGSRRSNRRRAAGLRARPLVALRRRHAGPSGCPSSRWENQLPLRNDECTSDRGHAGLRAVSGAAIRVDLSCRCGAIQLFHAVDGRVGRAEERAARSACRALDA